MKLESEFSCGDFAYCIIKGERVETLTIGRVMIEFTDSPGIPGTPFENYKPQKSYKETYMCVETGVSSGSLYTLNENIFNSLEKAEFALQTFNQLVSQKEARVYLKEWGIPE
jgi:hypothetical protein